MATYSILAIFAGKTAQYVDLTGNTLKVGNLSIGDVLLSDTSTVGISGSDKIGVEAKDYTNIADYSGGATLQTMLDGINTALASAGGTDFDDATFKIVDTAGDGFGAVFDVSAVTTADKTITMPDAAVDLGAIATNTAKVSADGLVTTHSDVTDAGSGIIISAAERTAIGTSTTFNTDLGLTTNGNGASKVSIEDAASQFTSTNVEGALDEALDAAQAAQVTASAAIPASEKGANSGVATLDAGGKIPAAQLPNSVMEFQGTWNATTNTPTLIDGTGNAGDVYKVTVAGTQDLGSGSISYGIGDWVMYSGTIWEKSDNADEVTSVHGRQGVVVAVAGDYTASEVTNVPAGDIAATTVQAAIDELDSDKYAAADFNSDWDTRLGTKSTTDLSEGSNLYYTAVRAQDATIVESFTVATGGVTAGDVVYLTSGGEVAPALATASSTSKGVIGVALTTEAAAGTVRVATAGKVTVTASATAALVVGDKAYLSKQTAGAVTTVDTTTEASGSGDTVLPLGVAVSSTEIMWNLGEPVEIQ